MGGQDDQPRHRWQRRAWAGVSRGGAPAVARSLAVAKFKSLFLRDVSDVRQWVSVSRHQHLGLLDADRGTDNITHSSLPLAHPGPVPLPAGVESP